MTSRLRLEYDGTHFAGWARQPGLRTVEDELERALANVLREERVPLTVGGRTDRGVHAWGQVCSYEHEAVDPLRLNAALPRDISVLECNPAEPGFDARNDALTRTYHYRIFRRRTRSVWWQGRALWDVRALDREALDACAAALVGIRDFTAFTPAETLHRHFRKEVHHAAWSGDDDLLEFTITAASFLRHMNRVLIGTMLEVGRGCRTSETFAALLDGAPRSAGGPTAPAHGLALAAITYP